MLISSKDKTVDRCCLGLGETVYKMVIPNQQFYMITY